MTELKEKLSELRTIEEESKAKKRASQLNIPYIDLKIVPIETEAVGLIPEEEAKKGKLSVIKKKGKQVWLAAQDTENEITKKTIKNLEEKGYQMHLLICSRRSLEKGWAVYKEIISKEEKEITGKIDIEENFIKKIAGKIKNLNDIKEEIEKIPTDQISTAAEIILTGGLQTDASDIHLETAKDKTNLRYRIDGILQDAAFLSPKKYSFILNRIKLLAGMKLNIRNQAQDGRFTISIKETDIEVRVSCIPSAYGENIVMRILNPKAINLNLEDLGLRSDTFQILEQEIKKPNGMIITTGPTGSGKTTLLYSFIKKVNKPEIKIITLEDPVEYHLPGITQTQIDTPKGYTFAKGLRAILRQDPDIILIGEIRDKETAEIAIQSALTGHLVFSTLHTNDAAGAIPRFLNIGAKASNLASALNLIIAQRLVRKLCPKCKKTADLSNEQLSAIKKEIKELPPQIKKPKELKFYQAVGCSQCNQTGYKGRIGIFESIQIKDEMEKLISTAPTHLQIIEKIKKQGTTNLYQDGLIKVLEGITTLEELERVVGE